MKSLLFITILFLSSVSSAAVFRCETTAFPSVAVYGGTSHLPNMPEISDIYMIIEGDRFTVSRDLVRQNYLQYGNGTWHFSLQIYSADGQHLLLDLRSVGTRGRLSADLRRGPLEDAEVNCVFGE